MPMSSPPSCPFTFMVQRIPEPKLEGARCIGPECAIFVPVRTENGQFTGMCAISVLGRLAFDRANKIAEHERVAASATPSARKDS